MNAHALRQGDAVTMVRNGRTYTGRVLYLRHTTSNAHRCLVVADWTNHNGSVWQEGIRPDLVTLAIAG